MVGRNHLGNRCFVECDKVKRSVVPPRKRTLVIGTVAAEITKRGVARQHQHKPQQMGNELSLWSLGLGQCRKYTLKQSHGAPPFSVALANTTLELEGSCGYLFVKTARSIDMYLGCAFVTWALNWAPACWGCAGETMWVQRFTVLLAVVLELCRGDSAASLPPINTAKNQVAHV